MNLFLHDIETFSIKRGDTLRDPRFREKDGSLTRFDAVIANPPFSLKSWGRASWSEDPFGRADFGVPPEGFADLAFIEHMVASMKRGSGRVAVVMPHGALFRTGAERGIRRNIIQGGYLEAVIGLAENLFYGTTIPATVLILSDRQSDEVLFIDASARFRKLRNQNEMTPEDCALVVEAYRTRDEPDGEEGLHVRSIPVSDIEANDWDLNISRYVEVAAEAAIEVSVALDAYQEAVRSLRQAEDIADQRLREAGFIA
jgi:type I restriction enzyme M protein